MARYRKIDVRIYADEKFRALSRPKPNGQSLFIYCLTCPETTSIPGLFCAGEAGMAEALGWSLQGFRHAFGEAKALGLIDADWKARVVWVPNAVKYNPPESINVVKAWRNAWDEIPECELKELAFQRIQALAVALGDGIGEAITQAFAKARVIQKQKQEQKQEQEQKSESAPTGFKKPTPQEVTEYAQSIGYALDGEKFVSHYEASGWMRGKSKIKDWKAAVVTWKKNENNFGGKPNESRAGHASPKPGKYAGIGSSDDSPSGEAGEVEANAGAGG